MWFQWILFGYIILFFLWIYFLIDPLELKLLNSYLIHGTFTQEIITQGFNIQWQPGIWGEKLCVLGAKILIIIGLFFYPLLLVGYLFIAKNGNHSMSILQKFWYHWTHPISFPYLNGGGIYSYLDYVDRHKKTFPYGGKLFWHQLFKKHNVDSPHIYFIIHTNYIQKYHNLPPKDLIVKPLYGSQGKGLEYWKYSKKYNKYYNDTLKLILNASQLIHRLKNSGNQYMVSEFVKQASHSPYPNCPQNIRIITYQDNINNIKTFTIQYNVQKNKEIISSNSNDKPDIFFNINQDTLFDGTKQLFGLNQAIEKAKILHSDLPFFSIGWDIILSDRGPIFLEGNLCHSLGNDYYSDDYYETVKSFDGLFRDYKKNSIDITRL